MYLYVSIVQVCDLTMLPFPRNLSVNLSATFSDTIISMVLCSPLLQVIAFAQGLCSYSYGAESLSAPIVPLLSGYQSVWVLLLNTMHVCLEWWVFYTRGVCDIRSPPNTSSHNGKAVLGLHFSYIRKKKKCKYLCDVAGSFTSLRITGDFFFDWLNPKGYFHFKCSVLHSCTGSTPVLK